MRLILQGRFLFVHIPFGSIVKFQFLVKFLVNYLPNPVLSSLIFSLRQLAAFTIIIIIILLLWELSTPALADSLPLEPK